MVKIWGAFLACHLENGKPAWHSPQSKIWWPHTESIQSLLLAYLITGAEWTKMWFRKIHDYTLEKLNEKTKNSEKDKSILDRIKQLEKNVAAQNKLACVFSKIKGDLARLIAAALRRSLKRRGASDDLLPPPAPE